MNKKSLRKPENILVTGGSGFIGSNFIRYLFGIPSIKSIDTIDSDFNGSVINVDCLTYASNQDNLKEVEKSFGGTRYFFEKSDICDKEKIENILKKYNIDTIVHFAAESHVDRSIENPSDFIKTNIWGTFNLLDAALKFWMTDDGQIRSDVLFHHISTDEVYGTLGLEGSFTEKTSYNPRSPYSASKASSDHLVMSYHYTFGLPVTISHCSNNYGPFQFPEKLIPLMIHKIKEQSFLPLYGNGNNVRDWIYVNDHCRAIWEIIKNGKSGEIFNVSGENEWENRELVHKIIDLEVDILTKNGKKSTTAKEVVKKIIHVNDRKGHDLRYSTDCQKIKNDLGWKQLVPFNEGLYATISWYLENEKWINAVLDKEGEK